MGLLRIILALSVVLMHANTFHGFVGVGGSLAVQSFFMVSGFYIGLILTEKYNTPERLGAFYLGRALRIYGLYFALLLAYVAFAVVFQIHAGQSTFSVVARDGVGSGTFWYFVLSNLLIFGQDAALFLRFDGAGLAFEPAGGLIQPDPRVLQGMFILPAWSLALELLFYLIAPFLARLSSRVLIAICAVSLALRLGGLQLGLIDDPWSYRFFPFELMHFIAGMLAYRFYVHLGRTRTDFRQIAGRVGPLILLFVLAYPAFGTVNAHAYFRVDRLAFLLILAVGLPFLFEWSRRSARDRAIGNLSYPVYLVHELVVQTSWHVDWFRQHEDIAVGAIVVGTLVGAYVTERLIDHPIERIRARLTGAAMAPAGGQKEAAPSA